MVTIFLVSLTYKEGSQEFFIRVGGKSTGIEEPFLENDTAVAFEIQKVQDGFQRVWSLSRGDSVHQLRTVKQASPWIPRLRQKRHTSPPLPASVRLNFLKKYAFPINKNYK